MMTALSILAALAALALLAVGTGAAAMAGDALLKMTKAMPASAGASVATDPIDTRSVTALATPPGNVEFELSAPALNVTMAPDTKTMSYVIEHDDDPEFGAAATLNVGSLTQTGAGGAGAAATSMRFRLPTTTKRYVRAKATAGADTTDSSAVSMTLESLT